MRFVREKANTEILEDTVFAIVRKAKEAIEKYGPEKVVNATIGSLYGENGKIVALKSVFENYKELPNETMASYASAIKGNPDYCQEVKDWVLDKRVDLPYHVIATAGGTGAIYLTITETLDEGSTLVIPEIAWPNYQLIAKMNQIDMITYSLFESDVFNLTSFKNICSIIMEKEKKLCVVINDPCHNPTGYSLDKETWNEIIAFLNECSTKGPVILLNDIAYFDYSYKGKQARDYMTCFNNISENVMVVLAFSISKSMTSYGQRLGAAILLGKNEEFLNQAAIVYEKSARAMWSNANNGAMKNFVSILKNHRKEYEDEKQIYVDLLKQRSDIFKQEADDCGLVTYPYKEGFFLTLKVEDEQKRDAFHEALMKNNIFTVKVDKGIRVGICSLPVKQCYGLAQRMKDIYDQI